MNQSVLDPEKVNQQKNIKDWLPQEPLPPSAHAFGYCIDFDSLQVGDLILFSATSPNLIGNAIRRVQEKGGYKPRDAQWEHAAVYIMSDIICEATRTGVRVSSLYEYMGSHKIRVRRNPNLSERQKLGLIVYALRQQRRSYGFLSILKLYLMSKIGFWKPNNGKRRSHYPKRAVYCSELYADAHLTASSTALGNISSSEYSPASLSVEPLLRDVDTQWVKII